MASPLRLRLCPGSLIWWSQRGHVSWISEFPPFPQRRRPPVVVRFYVVLQAERGLRLV